MARELPDLQKLLRRVQRKYWPECRELPQICWKYPRRKTKAYCLFGLFRPDENFIYVNFALSASWVPEYFLEYIIFHELMHRRQDEEPIRGEAAHSERFQTWEREFAEYDKARAWEDRNLAKFAKAINQLVRRLQ